MRTGYTPPPWTVAEKDTRIAIKAGARTVAYVGISADEEDNARLIAAAPELLAASKLILELLGQSHLSGFAPAAQAQLSNAITKAEGAR